MGRGNIPKSVCVFTSSSDDVAPQYFHAAAALGRRIAERGHTLVYGGGKSGLMGELARSAQRSGGRVVGIIPVEMKDRGWAYESADELIVTEDMRERKTAMETRADMFIALPGGFGTLEEIMEMLTLKQLQYHAKPIVLINTNGFYDRLINLFEHIYEQKFTKEEFRTSYHVAPNVERAFAFIDGDLTLR